MKIILITLLVYNFIGVILYYKTMHSRIVNFAILLYLVGVYLPVVFVIDVIFSAIRWKKQMNGAKRKRNEREQG